MINNHNPTKFDSSIKEKMKQAGWGYRRNYFYKRLGNQELVVEMNHHAIVLFLFDRKNLTLTKPQQKFTSLTQALIKSLQIEKKYNRSHSL